MKKLYYLLIGIFLSGGTLFGQIRDTLSDLERRNLNGKVAVVEERHYSVKKTGEKDSLSRAYYTIYSKEGYLLEEGNINIADNKRIARDIYKVEYKNGQFLGRYKKRKNGDFIPVVIFKHDSLNRISETIRFYSYIRGCSQTLPYYVNDGGKDKVKRVYLYDKEGYVVKCEVWYWKEKEWSYETTKVIENNTDNKEKTNLEVKRVYHSANKKHFSEYNQNDENGNWTLHTKYYKKKTIGIMERIIKYHER